MTLRERLGIQQVRLGLKLPTTIEEVSIAENDEDGKQLFPNASHPVILYPNGAEAIYALHKFEDGDVWVVRLSDHSDNWVTIRRASEADKRAIENQARLEELFPLPAQ